jgi:hypothetical protein
MAATVAERQKDQGERVKPNMGLMRPLAEYTAQRLAAVERRRAVRRARAAIRNGKEYNLADLQEYEAATVARCVRRFIAEELRHHPIYHLFSYWQLRRVGYDAWNRYIRDSGAKDENGLRVLLAPDATSTWRWWVELHWKQRYAAAGHNPFSKRDEMQQGWILCNPAFEYVPTASH